AEKSKATSVPGRNALARMMRKPSADLTKDARAEGPKCRPSMIHLRPPNSMVTLFRPPDTRGASPPSEAAAPPMDAVPARNCLRVKIDTFDPTTLRALLATLAKSNLDS